ncbi:hypothetical protein MCERE10_00362 [Burkholderiaceae bacterium]
MDSTTIAQRRHKTKLGCLQPEKLVTFYGHLKLNHFHLNVRPAYDTTYPTESS